MKLTVGSVLVLLGACFAEDQASNLQQDAQKEVVIEAVDNCPLGAGRCGGGGVAGNQYAKGQMDNGAYRMGQFAGQGNFGAIDSTAFAANNPYGHGGQMRAPPNMFYGSQFINQVQQCPPGSNCPGQQPTFPAGQPMQPPPMQIPADQGQMPLQDQGQMPPQDQGQADMMQDGSMPQQDGSMPIGDASQQKQQFDQYQQQQQYEQAQQQQRYGQFQQQQQPFCAGTAGGMGPGPSYGMPVGGPSYGMPAGGPAYGMPGNVYMNMMPQMGPYGGQFATGAPPCAGAGQGPWMNYGRGGCGGPANMQQIYG